MPQTCRPPSSRSSPRSTRVFSATSSGTSTPKRATPCAAPKTKQEAVSLYLCQHRARRPPPGRRACSLNSVLLISPVFSYCTARLPSYVVLCLSLYALDVLRLVTPFLYGIHGLTAVSPSVGRFFLCFIGYRLSVRGFVVALLCIARHTYIVLLECIRVEPDLLHSRSEEGAKSSLPHFVNRLMLASQVRVQTRCTHVGLTFRAARRSWQAIQKFIRSRMTLSCL